MSMRYRVLSALLLWCLSAGAQTIDLAKLKSFIESSKQMKLTDAEVAKGLKTVKLTEKLDDRTIENWLALGIGPKTRAALEALRDQSKMQAVAKLPEPPKQDPPPSSEEQGRILDEVRETALAYTNNLPNFLCTQVTRRKAAPVNAIRHDGEPPWQTMDTLTVRLSYFDQKEDYKLIMVNEKFTTQDYRTLGGATSTGEFGSLMKEIFEPHTETRFEWDHWGTLRGKRMLVFSYNVDQAHSGWGLDYERRQHIMPAYSGLVYIDNDLHVVKRITLEAQNIPGSFPIKKAMTILDYDFTDISGHEFLLPLKSTSEMSADGVLTLNELEFRLYRKYSTESDIKYDITPDPIPADQTVDCKDPKNASNPVCKK